MCVYLLLCGGVRICVNCITLYWQICGKKECRLISGKLWYGIITELLFKRLIQTTKHKSRFHDHFSKFLFTSIYELETWKTRRSVWQLLRQFLFLSNWAPFVICQLFNIIFRPARLCLRSAISMRNFLTNQHTQNQNHIFIYSLLHIPLDCPFH